jgi:hypothetical protein
VFYEIQLNSSEPENEESENEDDIQ